jgi:hypothetical protein
MANTSPCEEIASTIGELFSCSSVGEYTRIRTPYLYPDGDVVDLFLKTNGETKLSVIQISRSILLQQVFQRSKHAV